VGEATFGWLTEGRKHPVGRK